MEPLPPNTHRKGYLERVTTWGLESEICGFRWGHCPGRTSVSGYCRRKVDLGGPIRVATPRRVDWQAGRHGLPVKALSVGAGRSYCDGGVICRLLRDTRREFTYTGPSAGSTNEEKRETALAGSCYRF